MLWLLWYSSAQLPERGLRPALALPRSPVAAPSALPAPPRLPACVATRPGFLRGRIYGELEQSIALAGEGLRCGLSQRPGEAGTRLLFAPATGGPLLVIGVPAAADELRAGELPALVTLADQGSGRFYSSAGSERCWVRFRAPPGGLIAGKLYCAGALPAVQRRGSVTLSEFDFSLPRAAAAP
ncbi:MAG: hypothetical protein D6727_03290 [Gammaproteobacteria bacterium]|nr:MAG: hypothetical protein D6727_03290 [Gammaproteobacteria bacterium]